MKKPMLPFFKSIRFEYKISLIYLVIGLVWILFSDNVLDILISDAQLLTHFQMFKGSFYIIFTAFLLFLLVRRHIRKLKEQQFLFETMFNTIPDSVIISNTAREIIMVNKSTLGTFAYSEGELTGKPTEILYENRSAFNRADEATDLQHPEELQGDSVIRYKDKNNNLFPGEEFHTKLFDHEGTWIGNLSIIRNVTERLKFIGEIEKARLKAEESDRLKTVFLQNMSHEIRTPMNAVIGFSELLSRSDLPPEKQAEYKEIIVNSSNQLLSIVTDILTISILETKQVKISISRVNIHSLLHELLSVFLPQAARSGISIRLDKSYQEEFYAHTDDIKIRQILANLLSNAVKFTSAGTVEFGYSLKNGFLEFFVRDTGIGIIPELHEKIFERFCQVNLPKSKQYGGTGLGLSISKEFIELLGGKIRVESEEGKGATFYFTLPYNPSNGN